MASPSNQDSSSSIKGATQGAGIVYEFSGYTLDEIKLDHEGLIIEDSPIRIGVLRCLARYAAESFGTPVPEAELKRAGWQNAAHVSDATLTQHLYVLRDKLGKEFVTRRPYRLDCHPRVKTPATAAPAHTAAVPAPATDRILRLLVVLTMGVAGTAAATVPSRTIIALFRATLTQVDTRWNFFQGLFHGFVGSFILGTCIGGAILLWWFAGHGPPPKTGSGPVVAGWIGGMAGGFLIGASVGMVYSEATLASTPWLSTFLLFTALPAYGSAVGAGAGWVSVLMVPWWRGLAARQNRGFWGFTGGAAWRAFSLSWALFLTLAAVVALVLAGAGASSYKPKNDSPDAWTHTTQTEMAVLATSSRKVVGEGLSLYFGGVGLVTGLYAGLFILRTGISIRMKDE
ncbi:MAG: hypothetical protein ABSG65_20800 [Bryobacteraceae bacterium]|jgi:DNA-binding winged helix-turn-helix (wHTH) protein